LVDHPDRQVKRLGLDLMRSTNQLFRHWSRCRDGTTSYADRQRRMRPIRQEMEGFLPRGLFSGNSEISGMCRELYAHREWLWTFLEIDGVEPTNNVSERAPRQAVIWRKLSFGTKSPHGSRFVATILTVVETCRQQSRNVFEYLTTALEAHFALQAAPSLRPEA
jgi:transposase